MGKGHYERTGGEMTESCRKHLLNLINEPDPLFYLNVHEKEIRCALDISFEAKWESLKLYLEDRLIEFGYFKECTTGVWTRAYNGILMKMKELEEK